MASYVRGRSRRLPDDEIVRLYVGGLDSATVALQAGCDATTVLDLVRAAGETVRRRGGRPRNENRALSDAEICQRYQQGHNGPEIADAAGCTPSSVYNILARNGVERRDSSETIRLAHAAGRRQRLRGRPDQGA